MLWGREADSPRGRIYLIKAGLDGRATLDATFQRRIDACLGCMACVTACPSGVRYDRLIEATRPQIERHGARSLGDRLFRRAIFALFPHPRRLAWLKAPLRFYQQSGLQKAVRASGVLKGRLGGLEQLVPVVSRATASPVAPVVAAAGTRRRRVGLLLGCVQRVFFDDVNAATVRVLAAEGCEVVAPVEQECCGALMWHSGLDRAAADAAKRMIDVFEKAGVDQIVVNAAGCGSAMKEYGELLGDDPDYAAKARSFASKCVDLSEILDELEPRAPRHPVPMRIVYHDACHLQHAQRITAEPRRVLRAIPGLELREAAERDICCGSAGIYNLLEREAASALRDRKVKNLTDTSAEMVVSSNPGCLLQISAGLEAAGRTMRVEHLAQIVDRSIHK